MRIKIDASNAVAIALIGQLVKRGLLDADDVSEICIELSDTDKMAVQAAWLEGMTPDEEFKPTLRVVD